MRFDLVFLLGFIEKVIVFCKLGGLGYLLIYVLLIFFDIGLLKNVSKSDVVVGLFVL